MSGNTRVEPLHHRQGEVALDLLDRRLIVRSGLLDRVDWSVTPDGVTRGEDPRVVLQEDVLVRVLADSWASEVKTIERSACPLSRTV